jgi:hypothetical protein
MINELFNEKILPYNPPVRPARVIDFLEKLKTISEIEDNTEAFHEIDRIISILKTELGEYISYIRFHRIEGDNYSEYRINYFSDVVDSTASAEDSISHFLDMDYTLTDESSLLTIPNSPSIEDVFNQLNESNTYNDYIPLTKEDWYHKVIIFDRNASEEDIQKVYDFLISLGVKGFGPVPDDYLDEAYSFLQEYGHLYFKIYKVQKTYRINYDWDSDNYSAISSENVFTYSDVLDLIDVTKQNVYDILVKLNENTKTLKTPREGDFLVCHTPLVMSDDGEVCSIKGKHYEIIKIREWSKDLEIIGECGNHTFSSDVDSDYWYGIWFDLFTKEEKNEISGLIDNIFDEL